MDKVFLNILHENIFYYENAILNFNTLIERVELSEKIIKENNDQQFLLSEWKTWGPDKNNIFGMQKTINQNYITNKNTNDLFFNIINDIEVSITKCSLDYAEKRKIDIGKLMPISISKYNQNAMMGKHVDSYDKKGIETISVVGYINDDYEGGEIEFPEQSIKIKPSAGSIIIFPSYEPYFHISHLIKSGNKYICPGFWKKV